MKRSQELLLALIEPHVRLMGDWTTVLFKCWRDYSPVGVPRKVDDTIDIAIFPLIMNHVVISSGANCFYLDPEIVGTV